MRPRERRALAADVNREQRPTAASPATLHLHRSHGHGSRSHGPAAVVRVDGERDGVLAGALVAVALHKVAGQAWRGVAEVPVVPGDGPARDPGIARVEPDLTGVVGRAAGE